MSAYLHLHNLVRGHSDTVNCLAFSPGADYLASGSDDLTVVIWNVRSGDMMYRLVFKSPVSCLIWHPLHADTIICGMHDGTVYQASDFSPAKHRSHLINIGVKGEIHCMDYDVHHQYLAIGVGDDVYVIKDGHTQGCVGVIKLQLPSNLPVESANQDRRIRPRGLHFTDQGTRLVVSYLNHGVFIWDIEAKKHELLIEPTRERPQIGASALSTGGQELLLHNLRGSMDLIDLKSKSRRCKSFFERAGASRMYTLHVAFLHKDTAIVGGTVSGDISIWDTRTRELVQVLPHKDHVMQTVAVAVSSRKQRVYIAAGSSKRGQETYIAIWHARKADRYRHPEGPIAEIAEKVARLTIEEFCLNVSEMVLTCMFLYAIWHVVSLTDWRRIWFTIGDVFFQALQIAYVMWHYAVFAGSVSLQWCANMATSLRDALAERIRRRMLKFLGFT